MHSVVSYLLTASFGGASGGAFGVDFLVAMRSSGGECRVRDQWPLLRLPVLLCGLFDLQPSPLLFEKFHDNLSKYHGHLDTFHRTIHLEFAPYLPVEVD